MYACCRDIIKFGNIDINLFLFSSLKQRGRIKKFPPWSTMIYECILQGNGHTFVNKNDITLLTVALFYQIIAMNVDHYCYFFVIRKTETSFLYLEEFNMKNFSLN